MLSVWKCTLKFATKNDFILSVAKKNSFKVTVVVFLNWFNWRTTSVHTVTVSVTFWSFYLLNIFSDPRLLFYFFILAQSVPLRSTQSFSRLADSKYIKCLAIYVNKLKIIIKHYLCLNLYLQNAFFFICSSCPGMKEYLMKLCFLNHFGLLGVLISEWEGRLFIGWENWRFV